MNIAEYSVTKKVTTWLFIILFLGGGITALQDISRLEDPEFTIKEAKVYTLYPGATPQEVEREVTYHIEDAVQQLYQLKRVESISQNGFSEVTVRIKDKFKKHDFPNIWDELRRKVNDAQTLLPPGAQTSIVYDDFGDVFGLFYALTGEDYRKPCFRVLFKLDKGMEFCKHFHTQKGSLIYNQDGFHLFTLNKLPDLIFDDGGHDSPGGG